MHCIAPHTLRRLKFSPWRTRTLRIVISLIVTTVMAGSVFAGAPTPTTITVRWTSPGDDGNSGLAAQYDLRHSTSPITEANWSAATRVTGMSAPKAAGTPDSHTVTGLIPGTNYYFAIKAADEVPNWSGISNVLQRATLPEQTAPAAIAGLSVNNVTASTARLNWTAPGDDSVSGTAAQYDIRYATTPITMGNWNSATQATGEPAPRVAGTSESYTVSGLNPSTTYYFAVRTADEVPNWSGLSNVVSGSTSSEQNAPATVTNLVAGSPTANSVRLIWTAPGDDSITGRATQYDVRYSLSPITDVNWAAAIQVTGEPVPDFAAQPETLIVTGLNSGTTYYFAIKTADEVPNWSGLSNVPTAATIDNIAPGAIIDLSAVTGSQNGELVIEWTAPGDDGDLGRAQFYAIVYSTDTITAANWEQADPWVSPPVPVVSGQHQVFTMTGLAPAQRYWVTMKAVDESFNASNLSNIVNANAGFEFGTDVDDDFAEIPTNYELKQNYPNPFNPTTTINYAVPKLSHISITIYNVLGEVVTTLVDADKPAGNYSAEWSGADAHGRPVASGMYMYHIEAGQFSESRKMLLLK